MFEILDLELQPAKINELISSKARKRPYVKILINYLGKLLLN